MPTLARGLVPEGIVLALIRDKFLPNFSGHFNFEIKHVKD